MSKPRYDPTIVLPPGLAQRLAAIAAAEHLTLRRLVILAARECARAYPDRFRAGKRLWSTGDDRELRRRYPHVRTDTLTRPFHRTYTAICARAAKLGLSKSAAYLASPAACRLRRGGADHPGRATQFKPGQVPANKGLRRPGYSIGRGRMRETQFQKGVRQGVAITLYQPIGSERMSKEGYLQRKVNDDLPLQRRWRSVHVLVWEQAHGPVPRGHAVVFRNGDKTDRRLENLELITRRELMARNTVHNLPKPLAQAVQLLGALNRKIRRRTRDAEHDRRSA